MNQPIYGCSGCNTTAGAGGCPVHRNVNAPPSTMIPQGLQPTDYYGHWSTAQLALKAMTAERDALVLQIEVLKMNFFQIVGIMQGGGVDREVFKNVYEIAKEQAGLKRKCECVWLDGGAVGEYRDHKAPCAIHDKRKEGS